MKKFTLYMAIAFGTITFGLMSAHVALAEPTDSAIIDVSPQWVDTEAEMERINAKRSGSTASRGAGSTAVQEKIFENDLDVNDLEPSGAGSIGFKLDKDC